MTTIRILHISDIHFRSANGIADRAESIRRELPRRTRVLAGPAWKTNLRELLEDGPIHLVCLTGDIADWGAPEEYQQATKFLESLLTQLQLPKSRLVVIPGNHDIARTTHADAWSGLRSQSWSIREALSDWLAGGKPPLGVTPAWCEQVLERQSAYRDWLAHRLGRDELLPPASPHRRLGFRVDMASALGLGTPLWILGLDTAWLAGDDHDAGKLLVTKDQVMLLGTGDDGHALPGLRIALGHHPLGELADGGEIRSLLAAYADLYLHGHQHQPLATLTLDPDRHLLELAAGCLFEGSRKDEHPNGFQVISLTVDAAGRPASADLRFRSWSPRGGFWHDDSSIYRNAKQGRLRLSWNGSMASASSLGPSQTSPGAQMPSVAPPTASGDGLTPDARHVLTRACEIIISEDRVGGFVRDGEDFLTNDTPAMERAACREAIDLLVEMGFLEATPVMGGKRKWAAFVVTPQGFSHYGLEHIHDYDARRARLISHVSMLDNAMYASRIAVALGESRLFVHMLLEELIHRGKLKGDHLTNMELCVYSPSPSLRR